MIGFIAGIILAEPTDSAMAMLTLVITITYGTAGFAACMYIAACVLAVVGFAVYIVMLFLTGTRTAV
jgi:hypothetical protein